MSIDSLNDFYHKGLTDWQNWLLKNLYVSDLIGANSCGLIKIRTDAGAGEDDFIFLCNDLDQKTESNLLCKKGGRVLKFIREDNVNFFDYFNQDDIEGIIGNPWGTNEAFKMCTDDLENNCIGTYIEIFVLDIEKNGYKIKRDNKKYFIFIPNDWV